MTRGLADTSLFIARESRRPLDETMLPEELAVSVITIGELRAGVLAAADLPTRDRRLATLTAVLGLDPVPVDTEVAAVWARLRLLLRDMGLRMPVNDSWIAAIGHGARRSRGHPGRRLPRARRARGSSRLIVVYSG